MGADYKREKFNIGWISTGAVQVAGSTRYQWDNWAQANEARAVFRMPFDAVIRRLRAHSSGAPGVGETYLYTFRVGAANTALTCQTVDPNVQSQDLVNQVAVNVDDLISMRIDTSVAAAAEGHKLTVEIVRA